MPGTKGKYGIGKKGAKTVELTLPSEKSPGVHNVALVRVPDPAAFISLGILDQMDKLTGLVSMKITEIEAAGRPRSAAQAAAVQDLAGKTDELLAGLRMIDIVVEYMLVEPRVLRPVQRTSHGKPALDEAGNEIPLAVHERDPEMTYTDEIDLQDKMFLLSYSTSGSTDLESFRAGTEGVVDSLEASADVRLQAFGASGGN